MPALLMKFHHMQINIMHKKINQLTALLKLLILTACKNIHKIKNKE